MKGGTVQITWHDGKPVLTLDFHPPTGILATGGADHDIKLWVISQGGASENVPTACYQNSLSYHSSAVNILRFSPSGEQLVSGADGGEMVLWKMHKIDDVCSWKVLKTLLFHRKDVLDLEWSADGAYLVSGSVDNSCIIWDMNKGSVHQILDTHMHYVQGVAWDPLGRYLASISSDRTCRIYVNKPGKAKGQQKMNYVCQHVLTKLESPIQEKIKDDSKSSSNKCHLFHDETLPSFFRRLAWSPDGSFLVAPAGVFKFHHGSETCNTAYILSRKDLSRPALQLPGASKPIVAVRFCPVIFSLRGSNPAAFFKLPYRVVFAVATLNSLYLYDTEGAAPIAILAGLHYAAITDLAWSPNAQFLALASQDGYCTVLEFKNDELGSPISISETRQAVGNLKLTTETEEKTPIMKVNPFASNSKSVVDENMDANVNSCIQSPSTPVETSATNKSARKRITPIEEKTPTMKVNPSASNSKSLVDEKMDANVNSCVQSPPTPVETSATNKPARKRITPIEEKTPTTKVNPTASNSKSVADEKMDANVNSCIQSPPTPVETSATNKPARKRIIPIAVNNSV